MWSWPIEIAGTTLVESDQLLHYQGWKHVQSPTGSTVTPWSSCAIQTCLYWQGCLARLFNAESWSMEYNFSKHRTESCLSRGCVCITKSGGNGICLVGRHWQSSKDRHCSCSCQGIDRNFWQSSIFFKADVPAELQIVSGQYLQVKKFVSSDHFGENHFEKLTFNNFWCFSSIQSRYLLSGGWAWVKQRAGSRG